MTELLGLCCHESFLLFILKVREEPVFVWPVFLTFFLEYGKCFSSMRISLRCLISYQNSEVWRFQIWNPWHKRRNDPELFSLRQMQI
jgi:hypothetical protein